METANIISTACLIEALVISNTTAHNIDAHDKLAINIHIHIYIYIYIMFAIIVFRLFSVLPEPGDNVYIWSGSEGGAINGGVPPGSCYFGPWKTTPQWRAFVLLACE